MFGSDGSPIIQYVVIFAVIFTALAAIVFVVRRLTGRGLALPGRGNGRGRQPRLGIVDVYELDRARQLILLRRDNVEHLLLVGGPNDVVVERNIQRGQRPLPEASLIPEPLRTETTDALPDPLAGTGRLAEPQRPLADHRRPEPAFDPGFEMPVVVAPPVPRSGAVPPVTLPLDASLIGGDEPGQDLPAVVLSAPARTPVPAAQPAREPFSARRILRRTAPPLLAPRPEPASERLPGAPPATPEAAPVPPEALPEPPTATSPPPPMLAVPGERRPVDPGVLSDMARQLQAALARPASAVTPAPPPAVEARVDPVAAAMAAPSPPEPLPEPVSPEPAPEPTPQVPPVPEAVAPAPEPAAPPAVRPSPREKSPAPAPAAEAAPPGPAANPAGNPFSVEEIEAEFARLLGRPLGKRG